MSRNHSYRPTAYQLWLRRVFPLLIVALAAVVYWLLTQSKAQPEQQAQKPQLPLVETLTVTPQTMAIELVSYGVVEPKFRSQLVAEVKGRIVEVMPDFASGSMVKKGQVLARIEASDYQADLLQAQAQLAQAKASLDEELARGEVAKVEFSSYESGQAPSLGLRIPQIRREQANVKSAQASLAKAERNVERTLIRAQFDGLIKNRSVDVGQFVSAGTALGEVLSTQHAEIRLPLNREDILLLDSIQQPKNIVMVNHQLGQMQLQWQGKVIRSEGVVDKDSRKFYLVAQIDDPYLQNTLLQTDPLTRQFPLQFGSFVDASIVGQELDNVIKLQRHLLKNNQIQVVTADNQLQLRKVDVVHKDTEFVYLKDSIQANERIALSPFGQIQHGAKVSVADVAASSSSE